MEKCPAPYYERNRPKREYTHCLILGSRGLEKQYAYPTLEGGSIKMLQSLISLSDDEIELVTDAVNKWCRANHCAIDSSDGRRALTAAIDLVQFRQDDSLLLEELTSRLHPDQEFLKETVHGASRVSR